MKWIQTFLSTLFIFLCVVVGIQAKQVSHTALLQTYASSLDLSPQQLQDIIADSEKKTNAVHPAWSFGAPSGFVSSWGAGTFGLGLLTPDSAYDRTLAPFVATVGLGDAHKVGGSVSVVTPLINSKPTKHSFGNGLVGFKVGHTQGHFGVSAGVHNVVKWGLPGVKVAFYGSSSYLAELSEARDIALIGTVGVGNRYFGGVFSGGSVSRDHVAAFGSLALQVQRYSVVVDYTSKILNSGVSVQPFSNIPFITSMGLFDITRHLPDKRVGFLMTLAYHYSFRA